MLKLLMGILQRQTNVNGSEHHQNTQIYTKVAENYRYKNSRKSVNAFTKDLKISKHSIGRILYEDLRCKSHGMRRIKFIYAETKDNSLTHTKHKRIFVYTFCCLLLNTDI